MEQKEKNDEISADANNEDLDVEINNVMEILQNEGFLEKLNEIRAGTSDDENINYLKVREGLSRFESSAEKELYLIVNGMRQANLIIRKKVKITKAIDGKLIQAVTKKILVYMTKILDQTDLYEDNKKMVNFLTQVTMENVISVLTQTFKKEEQNKENKDDK